MKFICTNCENMETTKKVNCVVVFNWFEYVYCVCGEYIIKIIIVIRIASLFLFSCTKYITCCDMNTKMLWLPKKTFFLLSFRYCYCCVRLMLSQNYRKKVLSISYILQIFNKEKTVFFFSFVNLKVVKNKNILGA